MDITALHRQDPMPVTILHLVGELDGKSYQGLIDAAQREYDAGARDLVLDLSRLTYISSAGISALHTVAMLFRGQPATERQEGWASFQAINNDRHNGTQQHVKLLNPTQDVTQVLNLVGFNAIFDTFTDVQQAISSFH
jgi:anti-anti-sigma regulatory factor